jgi:hypothetical protein
MANKDRLMQLADIVEAAPEVTYNDDIESLGGFSMSQYFHNCGTPSCIAGHTIAAFAPHFDQKTDDPRHVASYLLGISEAEGRKLFVPGGWDTIPDEIYPYGSTGPQAAKVIRHFAETGEIDWEKMNS